MIDLIFKILKLIFVIPLVFVLGFIIALFIPFGIVIEAIDYIFSN